MNVKNGDINRHVFDLQRHGVPLHLKLGGALAMAVYFKSILQLALGNILWRGIVQAWHAGAPPWLARPQKFLQVRMVKMRFP